MTKLLLTLSLILSTACMAGTRYDVDVIGPMDGESLASAYEQLLGAPGPEVSIRINSPGGSVFTTLLFIDLVRDRKDEKHLHVTCVGTAVVASAAALLMESAACDDRQLEPGVMMLFHGVSTQSGGKEEQVGDDLAFAHTLNRVLAAIIAPRIHMTVDAYLAWIAGHDRPVSSDLALELGMVDRVAVWEGHAAPKEEKPEP